MAARKSVVVIGHGMVGHRFVDALRAGPYGGRSKVVLRNDELTPAEERVAALAAKGMTNKEIAAAIVVSAKTVEAHLGRTYRKLGVRSRAELAAQLSEASRDES